MHLLNTLPQRLDPGATPTFAGLIAPSLTSPASTNLTLGLGTGGTALTLASSTLAATFAGVVVVPDGSAAAPSLVVSSSPTTGFYRHGSGAIGFSSAGLACAAFSSNTGGGGLYLEALGTNQNIRLVPSGTGILTTAAPVTFTNTTAGSSGAGALVVAGGLATGAASYFGGAVTATGGLTASSWSLLGAGVWPTTTMGQNGSRVVSSSATENQLFTILNMNTAASGAVGINYGASIYLGARGTDNTADMAIAEIFGARESATSGNLTSYLSFKTSNSIGSRTEALRLASTGAATFAGAVTIAGTVIHTLSATPASASATGTVGTMSWDASYIYICTAANTWKRVAIATW